MSNYPRIGVGSFIINRYGEILLGKRKGSHGAGEWSLPGGHLDWFEKIEVCGRREIIEETGLTDLDYLGQLGYSENFFPKDNKHYLTAYIAFLLWSGEPKLIEPNKCEGWEWFPHESLPSPLFGGIKSQRNNLDTLILNLSLSGQMLGSKR